MSGRDRNKAFGIGLTVLFVAFIIGAVFASWKYYERNTDAREHAANYEPANSGEQTQTTCRIILSPLSAVCDSPTPGTGQGEQYTYQDLQAQQDMSVWAMAMMLTGGIGLLLTGVGVIYVALTLKATRDTVDVARDIGRKQVKAYLSVESAHMAAEYGCVICGVNVKNYGQSPTLRVQLTGVARTLSEGPKTGRPWESFTPSEITFGPHVAHIAAGKTEAIHIVWHRGAFEGEVYDKIAAGASVAFDLTLLWTDVFGDKDSLDFTVNEVNSDFPKVKFVGWERMPRRSAECEIATGHVPERAPKTE